MPSLSLFLSLPTGCSRTRGHTSGPGSDLPSLPAPAVMGKTQLPLGSDLGTSPQGKRKREVGDLVGSRSPTSSLEACPLPKDPRVAKMWPGPSLPLPLLATPPKGSHHKQSAPLRGPREGLGKGVSEARVSLHRGLNSSAAPPEGRTTGLEAAGTEGLPELPAHPQAHQPPPSPAGSSQHPTGLSQPVLGVLSPSTLMSPLHCDLGMKWRLCPGVHLKVSGPTS